VSTSAPDPPLSPVVINAPSFGGYALAEPNTIEGVSFWPRVGARVIDLVAHYIVAFCSGILFAILLVIAGGGHADPVMLRRLGRTDLVALVTALLGSVAYHTICEWAHGSSLGKIALSMVVVQEDGSPCRFRSALVRSLAYFVDALFFGLIGYFAMKDSVQQQRHGDQWAHTIVCKRSAAPPQSLRSGGRFVAAFLLAAMADTALIMFGLLLKVL
jgi:uncharacterized RDD family membrane protein YckC